VRGAPRGRDDLRKKLLGARADQGRSLLGPPDRAEALRNPDGLFWRYHGATADPATGEADQYTDFLIHGDWVTGVKFWPPGG